MSKNNVPYVSTNFLNRLPYYLKALKSLKAKNNQYVNSQELSLMLGYNKEQVKKDLQIVSSDSGKPKVGRDINTLINDIDTFLGYNNTSDAVIVGIGHLGTAFMNYPGFKDWGLNILAGFDINPELIGTEINGKPIFGMDRLLNLIPRLNAHIAILCVPSSAANEVASLLVKAGIKAIWNYAGEVINVGDDIIVENVNLASSLAVLSHKLKNKLNKQ